jgi:hypothetical protein
MIPTDEEIEKEAKLRAPFYSPQYIAFVEGVEWMRERCGLQWKKPSEEMPKDHRIVLVFIKEYTPVTGFYDAERKSWYFDREKLYEMQSNPYAEFEVAAWAYIELPDWLK